MNTIEKLDQLYVQRVEYSSDDYIAVYVGVKGLSEKQRLQHCEDVKTKLQDLLKHDNFLIFPQDESKSITLSVLAKV